MHVEPELNATIVERVELTPSLALWRIARDASPSSEFEPGQFTNLGLWVERADGSRAFVRRAFSMANSNANRDPSEFLVRRVEGGEFTARLFALARGARIWLDASVYGRFTLAEFAPGRDLVFVSSGTGVAPFVSMLRSGAAASRAKRIALLESVREPSELAFRGELEALEHSSPSFSYRPTITGAVNASAWRGARGRLTAHVEPGAFAELVGWPLDPETTSVFLCGNPQMIQDVGGELARAGFRPHSRRHGGEVFVERYW